MMTVQKRLLLILSLFFVMPGPWAVAISAPAGVSLTLPLIAKDPSNLHGYQAAAWIQPPSLVWPQARVYFDGGFGHWWVSPSHPNHSISIYSVSPYLRFYLIKDHTINPFIDLGIGLAWMTRTRLDDRNLGMHFAFQDIAGIGASFGPKESLSVRLSALHYSNGSLCNMNAGITLPLILTVALRLD